MAGEIPNPVRYDPRLDVFCCEQRRFGLRYDKRFVSADDALLYVRENTASCPMLQPHLLTLNDYHYGRWARQLEAMERHPVKLRASKAVWLLHLLAILLCVPLVRSMTGTTTWQVPDLLLNPLHYLVDLLSVSWHWKAQLSLFWLVLIPMMLLAFSLSRVLVHRIREAELRLELRIILLWSLPLLYLLLYLMAYIVVGLLQGR
jgi:hypothetical protein